MLYPPIFDLHCDTLTAFMDSAPQRSADTLNDPRHQFALCKIPHGVRWAQCCAIFVPDQLHGAEAADYYTLHRDSFHRQIAALEALTAPCRTVDGIEQAWTAGKTAALLTVENASALTGEISRIEQLRRDGVVMMTLTWNGANELGSGHSTDGGLTAFGKAAVREMERQGILVDVSHLNDRGFFDLLDTAQKPFVASHSNARAVCPHRRNLTDEQIREMVDRACLIGLNYYNAFLCSEEREATLEDLWRHVEHFLELGAQDCLALGSDFDGADLPPCLDSPEKIAGLESFFLQKGLSPALTENILGGNALRFLEKNQKNSPA